MPYTPSGKEFQSYADGLVSITIVGILFPFAPFVISHNDNENNVTGEVALIGARLYSSAVISTVVLLLLTTFPFFLNFALTENLP